MIKVLVFDPFSLIEKHSWQLVKLSEGLVSKGVEVVTVRCKRVFEYCTVMESKSLSPNSDSTLKHSVCDKCIKSAQNLSLSLFKEVWLEADYEYKSFKVTNPELDLRALYEPIIKFKLTELDINEENSEFFFESAKNFNYMRKLADDLHEEIKPSLSIVYSSQYSINSGYCASAMEKGIPVLFAEGSSSPFNRYSALRIWNWQKHGLQNPVAKSEEYDKARIRLGAFMHFRVIRKALTHSSYSKGRKGVNIKKELGIPDKDRLLVAVLSSSDEVFSGYAMGALPESRYKSKVFRSQEDWIIQTINIVKAMKNTSLLVRVHPREFANHRDSKRSEMSFRWETLAKKSQSAQIFWDFPENNLSIYDILKQADVVLTGWSSVAIEALFEKIPVVTYDCNVNGLPNSLTLTGNSLWEYERNIDIALRSRRSYRNTIRALKYISFRDFENTYRVGGKATEASQFFLLPCLGKIFRNIYARSSFGKQQFLNKFFNKNMDKQRVYDLVIHEVEGN